MNIAFLNTFLTLIISHCINLPMIHIQSYKIIIVLRINYLYLFQLVFLFFPFESIFWYINYQLLLFLQSYLRNVFLDNFQNLLKTVFANLILYSILGFVTFRISQLFRIINNIILSRNQKLICNQKQLSIQCRKLTVSRRIHNIQINVQQSNIAFTSY